MKSLSRVSFPLFCPLKPVDLLIKMTLCEGKFSFEIIRHPFYSPKNHERLEKNAKEMDQNVGMIRPLAND